MFSTVFLLLCFVWLLPLSLLLLLCGCQFIWVIWFKWSWSYQIWRLHAWNFNEILFVHKRIFPHYKSGFASIFDEIDAPTFTFIVYDYLNFEQFDILFRFILIPIVFIIIATTADVNGKKWQHFRRELANISTLFVPWQLRIKEIESHFGSVVASYFTFLRWLFWVNIVLAFTLSSFVILPEVRISLRLTQVTIKSIRLHLKNYLFYLISTRI